MLNYEYQKYIPKYINEHSFHIFFTFFVVIPQKRICSIDGYNDQC